jgi:biopolymer transport protein ExbD
MRRTRFKPEIKKNQTFTLNVTSMTDMFTILLVFLLQTFATDEVAIEQAQGIRLPTSTTEKNPVDGVNVSITRQELKLDQKVLAQVKNDEIDIAAIESGDSNFIKPLFNALKKINDEMEKKKDHRLGRVLFQADQELPYSTIRKVMYTASMAGFPNVKLITTIRD